MFGLALIFWLFSVNGQRSPTPLKTAFPVAGYALLIENEDGKLTTLLKSADLDKLKRRTIKISNHGKEATFEGFVIFEVLKLAGIEFGRDLARQTSRDFSAG